MIDNRLRRRELMALLAAGLGSAWLSQSALAQPKWQHDPFGLGVASGSPTHDSVVLWTRLHASGLLGADPGRDQITLRWELAHDDNFLRPVQHGQVVATPELAHSAHVEVRGLEPDRWYFYRFMSGDAVSPVGRTRTFPRPDAAVASLRLAYASCQKWEDGYFSAWRHMRAENLDAVMFLGDYIYEYPGKRSKLRSPGGGWVLTLDDYRRRYAVYKGDPDLQAMHAHCPWLMTWDDHEVQNDYAGEQAGDGGAADPSLASDFLARRMAAYQAYYEHMPLSASVLTRALAGLGQGAEMRIYRSVPFGRLANLYLLDARQYKDPQVCTRDGRRGSASVNPRDCPMWNDPKRSMLGQAQEQWLDQALAQQGATAVHWNVLGQQTLVGQRDFRAGPEQFLWNDGWDGYAGARQRLTGALQRHRVSNPVFLGGDVHENWVGHVKADYTDAASPSVGVEFCGTSITSRSAGNGKLADRLAENPHFVFAECERKGYGVAQFTPRQLTTTLRVLDDVSRPDSGIETLAQFAVHSGRPVIERV
ncbi:alkaline phosphatase D family protein [Rhodoferax sp.]|uniref:alkaline phosphatase D family protein n=1 Tax=Rhodoferax sp. TaxID=50421 RepID=UPI00277A298B|nr:alkaline phosphatase D family protein [Rhodoferax sp.]